MRHRRVWSIAFLSFVGLPLLGACGDDITGPEIVDPPRVQRHVNQPSLVVQPAILALRPGESIQLEAHLLQGGSELYVPDSELVWTSTNPDMVEVTKEGRITARKLGEALVAAGHGERVGKAWVIVSEDGQIPGHIWR